MEKQKPQPGERLLIVRRAVLNRVLTELLRLATLLEDRVNKSFHDSLREVVSGIWIGNGADAFVEEVSSRMLPHVATITHDLRSITKNLATARDIIDQADEAGQQRIMDRLKDLGTFF